MQEIEFRVPGNPKALKRHRTYTKDRNGKALRFARQVDKSAGDKADFLAKAMLHKPEKPFDVALLVTLIFRFPRPKSHFRTGKYADVLKDNAPYYHTSTPDADNLAKFVCDSLNGIFWKDDKVISYLTVVKKYSPTPEVCIAISKC